MANRLRNFFSTAMLDEGIYYGLSENDHLIAIAGTQVLFLESQSRRIGKYFHSPGQKKQRACLARHQRSGAASSKNGH